jgi:copper homeostasis protein
LRTGIEVCVQDVAGCLAAEAGGADRIELCCALGLGGLTPSLGLLQAAKAATSLEIVALLRPRAGDFLYDASERGCLLADLEALVSAGATGIALGALQADGQLDRGFLRELVAAAGGATLTCHRAFDHARDLREALDVLRELGFARVLSSGAAPNAPAGSALLRELVQAADDGLEVIAGAGVRAENVAELVRETNVSWVHLSAGADRASAMQHRVPNVPMGAESAQGELLRRYTDEALVRACRVALE